jgi:dihydroorotase
MLGLEYALALAFSELVDSGAMSEADVIARLSWQPAKIGGMANQGRPIAAGEVANLCVIDPGSTWTIDGSGGSSRSRNVPYVGREVRGRVRHTIAAGEAVVLDGEAQR